MRIEHGMIMSAIGAMLLALTVPGNGQDGSNPPYTPTEHGGVELYSRVLHPDASFPLPPVGGGFYLFTDDALTRAQADELSATGARFLGVLQQRAYAFVLETEAPAARAALMQVGTGTAIAQAADRLMPDAAEWLATGGVATSVSICFWEDTKAAEVRELLPMVEMALPADPVEAVREERYGTVECDGAKALLLAESPLVASIDVRLPGTSLNRGAATTNRATQIEAGTSLNLTGNGMVLGQWDNGDLDDTHMDFGGRVARIQTSTPMGGTGGNFEHATHVAGTMAGSGAGNINARGIAPAATVKFHTYSVGSVPSARRAARHNYYMDWDNHSWAGTGTNWGTYNSRAAEYDTDCRDLLMMGSQGAGNFADTGQITVNFGGATRKYDSLCEEATAKNMLVIGGHDDNGTAQYGYSSRGPTNDGRIKPDVCANGVSVFSTSWDTSVPNTYLTLSGTSMATPVATGILALLGQHYVQVNGGLKLPPDTAKAALIQTARDRINPSIPAGGSSGNLDNPGPDFVWGYGVVDAQAAAMLLSADAQQPGTRIARGAVRNGEVITWTVAVPSGAPELRLSLAWIDSTAGGTATTQLVNDLDLEVLDPSSMQKFPWTLDAAQPHNPAVQTAPNRKDNVEQVYVANPAAGTWTVRVRGFSVNDVNNPAQGFALAGSHTFSGNTIRAVNNVGSGVTLTSSTTDLNFSITGTGNVGAARVFIHVLANARGPVTATLIHPDNTQVALKNATSETRPDLMVIFPDSRTEVGSLATLSGKAVAGTWKLRLSGAGAMVRMAALEIDSNAPGGGGGGNPPVVQTASLPNGTVGVAYSATLSASGGSSPYTWGATGLPGGLSCSASGTISGTPSASGTFNVNVTVTDSASLTAQKSLSLTINPAGPPPLVINTAALPSGQVGGGYSATLSASGGTTPYSWNASALPAGLSCSTGGVIAGTPSASGTFNVSVTVNDSGAQTKQRFISLTISAAGGGSPPVISTSSLPTGFVGQAYSATMAASGGTQPYSWNWSPASGGSTPSGLSISSAGSISGAPTTSGLFDTIITVTDSMGLSSQKQLTLAVADLGGGGGGGGFSSSAGKASSGGGCNVGGTAAPLLLISLLLIGARRRKQIRR
jgi:hypothetical protein